MYAVWIKIDDTLPWIELKGEYPSRAVAKKAANEFLNHTKTKIVKASKGEERIKTLVTAKTTR